MTCSERRDTIYLHAAGVLDDEPRAELDAHLASGCPRCSDALAEAREELTTLVLALAPVAPPARVRERLLARAREQAPRSSVGAAKRTPRVRRWSVAMRRPAAFAGVAAGAATLAVALTLAWGTRERPPAREDDAVAALAEQLEEQDQEFAALEARVEAADEVAALLGARELEVLDLAAAEPGSGAFGRAFWDPDYRCYFRAEGLAPLPAERRYVLWMVGSGERLHAAGTLEPDPQGDATLFTRLPRELSPIGKSFVTAEATPHGEQPTGPPLLLGEARRN